MRKSVKNILAMTAVVAGVGAAPAIYADDTQSSKMGPGMMSQGGMMGMMNMMGQMSQMMESCNKMMQSHMNEHDAEHPNEQWREDAPIEPGRNG